MLRESDRRDKARIATDIAVEVRFEDGVVYIGRLIDISQKGIAFFVDAPLQIDDRIHISSPKLGNRTGRVVRVFSGGGAISLEAVEAQSSQLQPVLNVASLAASAYFETRGGVEKRRHERIPCNVKADVLVHELDQTLECVITNMSRSGCLLRSALKPAIGAHVTVGNRNGSVCRYVDDGFAVQFTNIAAEQATEAARPTNNAA